MSTKTQHRRTRSGASTSTASADACVGSSGMHDAALCERIRELEDKVRDLEGRDHCWHWHPPYYPYYGWTWNASGQGIGKTYTTGTIDISNTVIGDSTWQS